jgi:uncharacterized membrane protein
MNPYLWLKALHVASVLIFIGGLFAQTMIVAGQRRNAETLAHFAQWDRFSTVPAMLVAWLSGAALATSGGWFIYPWLWIKLVFVIALTGLHGIQSAAMRKGREAKGSTASKGPHRRAAFVAMSAAAISALVVTKLF